MHIYIISRSRYKNLAIESMKLLHLEEYEHYTIINAIEGTNLTEDDIDIYIDNNIVSPTFFTSNSHSHGSHGEKNRLALQISYLKTMKTFLSSNENYSLALVLEEDATLGMNVNEASLLLTKILYLPFDLDVFYLGWCYECDESNELDKNNHYNNNHSGNHNDYDWYTEALYPLCRHSILWTKSAAHWYMNIVKPLRKGFRGGDQLLAHYLCAYSITKRRLTKRPIFVQNLTSRTSTLGNHDEKALFFPSEWTCERWKSKCRHAKITENIREKT